MSDINEDDLLRCGPYQETDDGIIRWRTTRDGEVSDLLTNFCARILSNTLVDDGVDRTLTYDIEVSMHGRRETIHVPAARVGCGVAVVGHWRRGRRLPGEAHRHKLSLLFGIPRRAWDVEAGAVVPTQSDGAVGSGAGDDDTLAIAKGQIETILTALKDKNLTDGASAKLRDTLAKLLALRSRLERDRDLLEDRLVREHPEWARLKAAILDALKPHPKAAEAVIRAIT
jgi:hypothetical protein